MKGGADKQCSLSSVLLLAVPRGSIVPYKSKEHPFCEALLTDRTVLEGCLCQWVVVANGFTLGLRYDDRSDG